MGAVRARSSWLLWFGVALAPVAALLLAFGQGTSPLRIAAVLALVAVVLIGLSVVLRPEPAEIRDEITDDMQFEVDQVRDEVIVLKRDMERSLRAELERVRVELAQQRQAEPIDLRAAVPAKQRNSRETERVVRQDRNTRDTDRVAANGRPARNVRGTASGTPAGPRGAAQVARASVNGNRPEGDRPVNRPISGSPISPVSGQTQPMPTIDAPKRSGGRASVPPPPPVKPPVAKQPPVQPPAVEPPAEPRRPGRAHVGGPDPSLANQLDNWLDSKDKGARQSPLAPPPPSARRKQEPPAAPAPKSSRWSSYQVDNGSADPLFGDLPPARSLEPDDSDWRSSSEPARPAADPYDPEATQPYDPPGPRRRRRAAEEPSTEDTGYAGGRRSAGSHSGSSYGAGTPGTRSGASRSSRSEVLGRHSQSPPPGSGRHSRGTDSY